MIALGLVAAQTCLRRALSMDIACANRGILDSGALRNERSYYRGNARQSVLEPESQAFLDMAAEIAELVLCTTLLADDVRTTY
jgi:hypothetical protein